MTDKQDTEKSSDRANEPQQRFRHSRRLGMMRSLTINLALIVIPLLLYFVVVIEHSSTYADQRSLRALQEIGTQIDNRLDTLKNILGFASGELQRRIKSQEEASKQGGAAIPKTPEQILREIPRIPVLGLSFEPSSTYNAACKAPEHAASDVRLVVDRGRDPVIRMIDCNQKSWNDAVGENPSSMPVVKTMFSQMIENTEALAEVPLIIVASEKGDVYAQLMRNHDKDPNPPAHLEVREEATVASLKEVLAAAEKHAVNDLVPKDEVIKPDKSDKPQMAGLPADKPGLPVSLDTHIAGTPYRAYVLPYPLKMPVCDVGITPNGKTATDQCAEEKATVYLVGLRKSGLVATATGSLSPVLLLGALLALIAAGLLWPFLRHALLEPNDAVTWRQVRTLCVAFLVLAALGVLAARASELGLSMYEKMDRAIDVVGDEIDDQMNARIVAEIKELDLLEREAKSKPSLDAKNATKEIVRTESDVSEEYPIVEQFFQTNQNGVSAKSSWTYDALKNKWERMEEDADLSDRPYFYLLRDGHGVREYASKDNHGKPYWRTPILLQRIFNKSDGKKILQLAVSRGNDGAFEGVSAVNIGTIEVISPVLPLGIGYAIFERSTGTVVFHSDDSRSLVENLYAETEHNPTLLTAVDSEAMGGTSFSGRYRGANTTFLYKPMQYSRWGLVVFYNSSSVSAVLALSVISALAATLITLLAGLLVAHAVMRMMRRRHSWLWPQWRLRNAYPVATIYLVVVSVCEFQILRHSESGVDQAIVLLSAPLLVLTACFSALSARTPDITARRPRFLRRGLSLVEWSRLLHGVLLAVWVYAAWAAGEYLACFVLVLAFLGWRRLLVRSVESPNENPWRRDASLWPGGAMPAIGRASYRLRYLLFVASLAVVVSVVPTLAIFDRTFEWYLSSALNLARTGTNQQLEARALRMKDDTRGLPQYANLIAKRARDLGGFGATPVDGESFDVDGGALFKVESPKSCFNPPVAWPLGVWETKMRWGQELLERLRQEATTLEAPREGRTGAKAQCGVHGTIHELVHAGGMWWMPVLWDVVSALVVLVVLMLLLTFIARHVTGIFLPWSGRFGPQSAHAPAPKPARGKDASEPRHILLLQPNEESIAYVRRLGRACSRGNVREVDVAAGILDDLEPTDGKETTWLLRRVDIAVLDENRRVALLRLLETLVADPHAHVAAIGDVSPVYRIARPQAYPGPSWPRIDDHERLRWIDLFTHFHKVYSVDDVRSVFKRTDGGTRAQEVSDEPRIRSLEELIYRETRALWPCLRPVRGILLDRLHADARMTDRDVIELVALHGEVHFRKAWEYCTREERLALYHLAQGKLINMANHRLVEHLLRRGLVVFEPEPRIKSVSLMEFIRNAELPGRMEAWAAEAAEGLWQSVRVPFFVVLMLVVAWIAYSSGDALQAVVALVATSVAVIGQALRLLGMAGFSTPVKDK